MLGPAADPLPVFHDAKAGGYGIEDVLKARRFAEAPSPAAGARVGSLEWTPREVARDGTLAFARAAAGRPAVAWAATYLETARFAVAELEVKGTHPRRASPPSPSR